MASRAAIRFVEGLGYVGAAMIGLTGVTGEESLRYFLAAGLFLSVVAIVRLLAINIRMHVERGGAEESDLPDPARRRGLREEETQ